MVIISHDRHFLNQVCTHMADLDYGTIQVYPGSYDEYMEASTAARARIAAMNAKSKDRIADLEEFVRRFSAHKAKARQATSRKKQIEKLKVEDVKPSSRQYPWIRFDINEKERLHRQALEIERLQFGHDPKLPVIKNLTLTLDAGDRLAVIGENGVGKTTLMRLLMGELTAQHGTLKWAEKARPGYYAQDHAADFASDLTLTEWITGYVRAGGYDGADVETLMRQTLGRLLFGGDDVKKPVRVISGGEQGRMIFGKLMLLNSNVLVLDEPTNHLDMESIESLNTALEKYEGTLVFVSHDREFVSSLATRILEIKQDGSYVDYRGTYDEYLHSLGVE
jgi:ATPase subunit of ABC transporter with duplicated ATPase domains